MRFIEKKASVKLIAEDVLNNIIPLMRTPGRLGEDNSTLNVFFGLTAKLI